jgi:hypothetical protein
LYPRQKVTNHKYDREKVIKLVEWPVFDKIILFLIAVNCAILIFDDPICRCASSDQCVPWDLYQQSFYSWDCSAWRTTKAVLSASENVFTSIFAAEVCALSLAHPLCSACSAGSGATSPRSVLAVMPRRGAQMVLKIFARGFVMHKHAYLRDPWNWLDFGARALRPPASPVSCSPSTFLPSCSFPSPFFSHQLSFSPNAVAPNLIHCDPALPLALTRALGLCRHADRTTLRLGSAPSANSR